jgi:LysM repeat protein
VPEDSVGGMSGRPESVPPPTRSNRTVTPAIAGALVVLAASFALSVAFVLANGGLDLPAAQRPAGSGNTTAVVPSAGASAPAGESVAPSETTAAGASPGPSATEAPGIPAPSAGAATPRPFSNRYDLLTACPNTPDCWVYVVRQGDNLFSIARYFGVPLNVVEQRNPWTATTQLVAGQKLLLPAPTR